MFKEQLYRVAFGFAAFAALSATTVLFAQDDGATKAKRPLSVPSIRPFQNPERSASQAPNIYDKTSDEFDYFREELGRSETSTKTKKRLQEIESRVVYADPNDKPAYDGTKFVDIYADVYVDGAPYEDPDDPDVKYFDDENNILATVAQALEQATQAISLLTGVSAGASSGSGNMTGSGDTTMIGSGGTPYPMPTVSAPSGGIDNLGSGSPTDPSGRGGAGSEAASNPSEPSKNDDTKMVFPEDVENPYKAEAKAIADEAFDFFKADREFKPKATASNAGGMPMGSGGMPMGSGNATSGAVSIPMGSPSDDK